MCGVIENSTLYPDRISLLNHLSESLSPSLLPLPHTQQSTQDRPISGEQFVAVHVDHQVGATEQLNPLLVGLSNMAISYLPVGYKLDSVLSATREVVRGVRYSLVVNAVTDTSEPLVCQIQVLEEPWILMQWGEKHRTLIHTNCTAEQYGAVAANEDKFSGFVNPVFVNNRGHVDDDGLKSVEGQIVQPKKTTQKPAIISSLDDLMKQLTDQIVVETTTPATVVSTSTEPHKLGEDESTSDSKINLPKPTTPKTEEFIPWKPLDDTSKSLLDDFFNVDNNYRTQEIVSKDTEPTPISNQERVANEKTEVGKSEQIQSIGSGSRDGNDELSASTGQPISTPFESDSILRSKRQASTSQTDVQGSTTIYNDEVN